MLSFSIIVSRLFSTVSLSVSNQKGEWFVVITQHLRYVQEWKKFTKLDSFSKTSVEPALTDNHVYGYVKFSLTALFFSQRNFNSFVINGHAYVKLCDNLMVYL